MTPLALELLLHCYYCPEPPNLPSEVHSAALAGLVKLGVVAETSPGVFSTTALGTAWVLEILDTPIPKLQYVGASGKVYEA